MKPCSVMLLALAMIVQQPLVARAQELATPMDSAAKRTTVFVSDVHMGYGCVDGSCPAQEDARWPRAWAGFLEHLQSEYDSAVDLVVLGDFLELWQHPNIDCTKNRSKDEACSIAEIEKIVNAVLAGHGSEIEALKRFLEPGGNKLFIVPGNHDAGLLTDAGWNLLEGALSGGEFGEQIQRVSSGRWTSDDGRLVAEHGHQIGPDANRFTHWPELKLTGEEGYLERTWGEHFVQRIYNDIEGEYQTIDNFKPSGDGVKLYMNSRGLVGTTLDVSRFILFNIFQSSWRQKLDLGADQASAEWSEGPARQNGYYLVAAALAPDDSVRIGLLKGEGEEWAALRQDLQQRVLDADAMPKEQLFELCDEAKLVVKQYGSKQIASCTGLGGQIYSAIAGERVLNSHLTALKQTNPSLEHFVYGHTHEARIRFSTKLEELGGAQISVTNTGAFQRLTSRDALEQADDLDELKAIKLETLEPCYTYVVAPSEGSPVVFQWRMDEGDEAGQALPGCADVCKPLPEGCE